MLADLLAAPAVTATTPSLAELVLRSACILATVSIIVFVIVRAGRGGK